MSLCKYLLLADKPIGQDAFFEPKDFFSAPDDPSARVSVTMQNFDKTIPDI
jgi:hypothetical protein